MYTNILIATDGGTEKMNVRFGSLADMASCPRRVCFTPESCRSCRRPARPLWAKSRHSAVARNTEN